MAMLSLLLKLTFLACWLAPVGRCLARSGRGFRFVPIGDGGTRRITDPYYIEFLLGRLKRDMPSLFPSTSRRSAAPVPPHDYQQFILGKRDHNADELVVRSGHQYFLCATDRPEVAAAAYDQIQNGGPSGFLLCRPLIPNTNGGGDIRVAYDPEDDRHPSPDKRVPDHGSFILGKRLLGDIDQLGKSFRKRSDPEYDDADDDDDEVAPLSDRYDVTGRSMPDYIDFVIGRNRAGTIQKRRRRRSAPEVANATSATSANDDGDDVKRVADYVTDRKRDDDDARGYVPRRGYFSFRDFLFGHKRIPDYGQFILGKKNGWSLLGQIRNRRLMAGRNKPHYGLMESEKRAFLMGKKPIPDYGSFVLGKKNDAGLMESDGKRPDYGAFIMGKKDSPDYGAFLMGKKATPSYEEFLMGNKDTPDYEKFLMGKRNDIDYSDFLMGKKNVPDYERFLMGKKYSPDYEKFLMGKKFTPEYEDFIMGKKSVPDYEKFILGKKDMPDYERFLMGKKNTPDYEKFLIGKREAPDYENFLMGKKNHADYERFLMGKKYTPGYEEFLMGKKNVPDYEDFLMGKRNNPDYESFLLGKKLEPQYEEFLMGKKDTPDYEKFLMGKKDTRDYTNFLMGKKDAPDYERFLMGKKAPRPENKMDYDAFLMGKRSADVEKAAGSDSNGQVNRSEKVSESKTRPERDDVDGGKQYAD